VSPPGTRRGFPERLEKSIRKARTGRKNDRVRREFVGSARRWAAASDRRQEETMALKTFRPYTPSRRFLTMLDKSEITKETPEKSLTESKKRTGGRNSHGEVTSWHRGGG